MQQGWTGCSSRPDPKYCCAHHKSGPGYHHATQPPSWGGLVPPRVPAAPWPRDKISQQSKSVTPPGTCQWGQVTLTYGCWVVTCLVLSPVVGRVVGCSEDNVVGMVVVGMGLGMIVMVLGEEGWMQRAGVMQGRVELSPPPQVHVQQTATHQVSRPQSTVYCPALSRVRCPSHCYCHTSDRGKRLSSGLEGS